MQIEKNIAATLRHRMEAEKKSKLEFSKELGIPRSTFQGYLKGENCLRSDSIEEIAKGLNITPAQLISGPEDAAAESLRLETLLPQIPALHPQAQRLAKDAIALFADRLPRLAGADVHRCARLRAGCSGGRLPIFSAGDLAAGAHALLLRASWPAAAKRLLDDALRSSLPFSDDRAAVERLARLCTAQQLDPVHLFDVIHDFLDQEAATV